MNADRDDALLREYEREQNHGVTMAQFAESKGLKEKTLNTQLYRARKRLGKLNEKKSRSYSAENPPESISEKVEIQQDGPQLSLNSYGDRIKTVDDLVMVCKIDLSLFTITQADVKKWDVILKDAQGEANPVPAFYVSVKLIPRKIQPAEYTIQPVVMAVPMERTVESRKTSGRGLVIPDTQIGYRRNGLSGTLDPFHDRSAMDVVLQIAQDNQFDRVTWLGDILDCSEWSDKFVREPAFYFTTQPAVYEAHWWMSQFRLAASAASHDAIEGNHDARPEIALANHLLAAHGLTSATAHVRAPALGVENLLALDELGIAYRKGYPNNESWQGPVRLIHGDIARNAPGGTVGALAAQSQEHAIQGHIHRLEMAFRTIDARGKRRTVGAYSAGCLCRLDYVVPGHKRGQQWQQGCMIVDWDGDDVQVTPITITGGRAVYGSKIYRARGDVVESLNRDTKDIRNGWKF